MNERLKVRHLLWGRRTKATDGSLDCSQIACMSARIAKLPHCFGECRQVIAGSMAWCSKTSKGCSKTSDMTRHRRIKFHPRHGPHVFGEFAEIHPRQFGPQFLEYNIRCFIEPTNRLFDIAQRLSESRSPLLGARGVNSKMQRTFRPAHRCPRFLLSVVALRFVSASL